MLNTLTKKLHNKKGFTLIELIVVIAIIAILAAVLIPRFTGFTDDARQKAAMSDARNILVAVEAMRANGDTSVTVAEITSYAGVTFDGTFSDDPIAITAAGNYSFTYTLNSHVATITNGEIVSVS